MTATLEAPGARQAGRAVSVAAMFAAGILFAGMVLCTKAACRANAGGLSASEIILFRWLFGVLVLVPLQGRHGIDLWGKDRRGLTLRGIFGGLSAFAYFLSIRHTTIAHAILLNNTNLVFAPIFAAVFLKERVRPLAYPAIAAAAAGIILVTRPTGAQGSVFGDLVGLTSGLLAGAAIMEVRRLRRTETAWSIFFYLSLVGALVALGGCFVEGASAPTPLGWWMMAGAGLFGVTAQLLMTYGYKRVRAAEGGVMTLSQIVYAAAAGSVWFGEELTVTAVLGGVLILGAAITLALSGER